MGQRSSIGVLLILFATWGTVFLDRMAQLYLAPYIIPDLHLTNAQVGVMASVVALSWAASTLLLGALSDRIGRRRVLLPAIFIFSALSWVSGVVQTYEQMLVVRALLGLAEGPCWSVITALVEESSEPRHRGRNVGLVVSAASLVGLAVAPVLTTQVAAHVGWRWAFFVAGLPGFIFGLLVWRYVPEPAARAERAAAGTQPPSAGDYLSLFRYRNIWLCCLAAVGVITWLFETNVFGPLYMTQVMHLEPTTAGFLMGAAGVGSFFSGLFYPTLSDRIGRRPTLLLMGAMISLNALALLSGALYQHLWVMAVILLITNAQQGVSAVAMVLVPTETVPARFAATAIGVATLAAEALGATLAPAIGGRLAESMGLAVPLWMAVGGAGMVLVAGLLIKETVRPRGPAVEADAVEPAV